MSKWQKEKKAVLDGALKMVEKGLVVGKTGNVSMRLPSEGGRDLLAITPSRIEYDSLRVDDIQVLDFQARPVEGNLTPSMETMMHIGIYKARKSIKAIFHTHSLYASVMAVAGLEIPPILEDQVAFLGGEVKLARYAISGSDELAENVIAALGERNAALLPNHGVVAVGRTMREALTMCEVLEKTARIYICALGLGKVNTLSAGALEVEKAFFKKLQEG